MISRPAITALGAIAAGIAAALVIRKGISSKSPQGLGENVPLDDYAASDPTTLCDPTPKSGVLLFRRWILSQFPEAKGAPQNILRDCSIGSPSEHWEGRAWDFSISSLPIGQAVVDMLLAPDSQGRPNALARRAGIMYLIFNHRMWRAYPSANGPAGSWADYHGTSAHTDHVHFSFSRDGAEAKTSLYRMIEAPAGPPIA